MFIFEIIMIIAILAALFYVSMVYNSAALLVLTIASAVFVVLSIIYLALLRKKLSVRVSAPIGVTDAGQSVKIRINVNSKSRLLVPRLQFSFFVRSCFDKGVVNVTFKASDIVRGDNVFDYEISLKGAGCYEIGTKRLYIYDFMGLIFCTRKNRSNVFVQVLPEVTQVGIRLTEPVRNFYGEAEVFDDERAGQDNSEIFSIREYQPGDRIQAIHWKLTAKADELMVKELSRPKACPVVLFLEYNKGKNFDAYLQIAASLSFSMLDAGCPHYMAWIDAAGMDVLRQRVDSVESYYQFCCRYLKEQTTKNALTVKEMYSEKYRSERYLYGLRLDENLTVTKGDEQLLKTTAGTVKEDLGGLEIVL